MALNADEPPSRYIAGLVELLALRPGRLEFAGRLGLICALTVLVTEIYQTPDPALTAYVVFFLNRGDRATSVIMSIAMVVVMSLSLGLIFIVMIAVLDDPMWRFISIALLSFALLFLGSASKLRPIGSTVALITGYGLDELGLVQIGEVGTRALLYVWLFVAIPAAVSIIVNLLFAPAPRRLAERAIALRLKCSSAMLRVADEDGRREFEECRREGTDEVQHWVKLAGIERTSPPKDIKALRQAADSTVVLLSAIDVMDRNPHAQLPAALRESLARKLDEMAAVLETGSYPIEITWEAHDTGEALNPLAARILAEITDAVVHFAEQPSPGAPAQETAKEAGGFFAEDAFTNPDHVRYALKTTAAAMFCYVLYSLLDWPGIHTSFITCYTVSLSTVAETTEKLTLRILGCLIGAGAGIAAIVFLVPSLTSIEALMVVVFLAAFAAAYVVGGGPRISYAGFQIAFAFFLSVVQGPSPKFEMTIARDRVIGILIGNLVTYLIFANLWPISVGKRIDPAIAALLRSLGTMLMAANPSARRTLAAQTQSALVALETDIDLVNYEPDAVRPPPDWLAARREVARAIGALEGPLVLLNADQYPAALTHIASRLETIASRFAPPETLLSTGSRAAPWSAVPLFDMVEASLRSLEEISTRN
jgi:multidrug resistance protein MdtO